ncbi:putative ABC transport system permease protein [Clostridium collagenovorans DSM 3089]|uniref:Putative ABC transport system permease protein n=1 Tax=Clostridium collagenovorans DSM 3089 TaxID=1121306 RepID=A0A1M5SI31_9CLOT|nr:ABC transporter permease [Clostridium collagenovorans]SHH38151.1 putative ABC transport system permease protein [Clostridium collagenovorans DSM 3089]
MNNLFYSKLAISNIKKNGKTYIPYIITCICTIIMFYIMHSLSINKGLDEVAGSANLKTILSFGTVIIAIFSFIFLFYTNSFLIKRRKKEIGLYNVLGLDKKHIAKVLLLENLVISVISLVIGLLGGIVLNKLMFLLLLKMLNFKVVLGFQIDPSSIGLTTTLFISIFLVNLLWNLFQIKQSNPIELLKGGQHGEKEPKTKIIMTIIGLIALGSGYGIALTVDNPLEALSLFFVAVILVMIGTYELFTAGSIALLKLLRKNKKFYYKTKNFISVSTMMYRMKQNAVGLANICILSSAVLVVLSTTASLYVGMEDTLRYRYPRNITIYTENIRSENIERVDDILDKELKENNVKIKNAFNYTYNSFVVSKINDDKFSFEAGSAYDSKLNAIMTINLKDYNRMAEKNITLNSDEIMIFSTDNSYEKDTITFGEKTFKIKEELNKLPFMDKNPLDIVSSYVIITNNIEEINSDMKSSAYTIAFDMNSEDKDMISLSNDLRARFVENNLEASVDSVDENRESFLLMNGGLFFLGIFLGTLFLMATVLIIYYKQISEGYDDKERFEIMQKVGMSKEEIRKTIRNQVLMVFFLPLLCTIIHIAFAFPMITKLLAVLNLINKPLFMMTTIVTILIFTAIYAIVFAITARIYYKIVE